MRKTTFALALGLALTAGAADLAAQQQQARPDRVAKGNAARGQRGPGPLLKGITLTDAQQAQLKAHGEQQRAARRADRAKGQHGSEAARAARQRGDTAALRTLREQQRAQMTQVRERELATIRGFLTAEQRVQFDRNVEEMKARAANRPAGAREGRGLRGGRGGGRAPRPARGA